MPAYCPAARFSEVPERDWPWLVNVNQLGVVHGMEIFAPLIISHGEGGHFVNTASMAGMIGVPGMEAYCATKFAVVAMSEGWAPQLATHDIGLSVLCPGFVKTRGSMRVVAISRPARAPAPVATEFDGQMAQPVLTGIDVDVVAERVLEGVLDNDLYIFTHPELRLGGSSSGSRRFMAAFEKAAASPLLAGVPRNCAHGCHDRGLGLGPRIVESQPVFRPPGRRTIQRAPGAAVFDVPLSPATPPQARFSKRRADQYW